jgi:hypothetical protein
MRKIFLVSFLALIIDNNLAKVIFIFYSTKKINKKFNKNKKKSLGMRNK